MNNIKLTLFFVIGISLVEALSQYTIKRGSNNNNEYYILIGGLLYMIVSYLLYKSYKYNGLGIVNLSWSCISIILGLTSGILFFNEKLNRYTILSVILAILAIYISHINDNK